MVYIILLAWVCFTSVFSAKWLGHCGLILVLFETSSGFALFNYDGVKLFRPKALEDIWADFTEDFNAQEFVDLKEFKIFEDKASAINSTGVGDKLAKMIKRWLSPRQKLAVGKSEYKTIVEKRLGIHCLFDDAVLEVLWGLKNSIKILVPGEELELTNEDRLQMSQGMKLVLNRYGFEVEAKMVNSHIIDMASAVHESDRFVNKRADFLLYGAEQLAEVSGFDSQNWDLLKLETALKLICYPKEEITTCDHEEILSEAVAHKLVADAGQYEDRLHRGTCLAIYKEVVWARSVRRDVIILLASRVKEAKEELKLHQGCSMCRGMLSTTVGGILYKP